jgi:hypothetical protein
MMATGLAGFAALFEARFNAADFMPTQQQDCQGHR